MVTEGLTWLRVSAPCWFCLTCCGAWVGQPRSYSAVTVPRVSPRIQPREVPDLPGAARRVSHPGYAGYAAPYLTVFSENAIDVFDVRRAEWVQTVPLKKVSAGTSLIVQ